MRPMNPVFDETLALGLNACALTLGDLVLVMGKHEVFSAEMQIETRSQPFHAHGAALDVPSGPPLTPRARPKNLPILPNPCLPQREVRHRFFLIFVAANPLP